MTLLKWADADYTPPTAGMGASELDQTPLVGVRSTLLQPHESAGSLTLPYPIGQGAQTNAGVRAPLFADDLLNRVHVTPATFALGNFAGTVTRTINVWNAQPFDVTLLSIGAVNADGVTITGHAEPPLTYGTLQDRDYTLTFSPTGPAALAATWTWNFSDGAARAVVATGNRAVAWTWAPDWGQPLTERLEWRTEVLRSFNGREQRRRLRQGARRSVEMTTLMTDADRERLELALFGWGARTFAFPLWWDGQAIASPLSAGATSIPASTTGRELAAGRYGLLVTGNDANEIVEVLSTTASAVALTRPTLQAWPAGTMFYPATIAQLEPGVSLERFTAAASILRATFNALEPADVTEGTLPTYLGNPVLDARPLLPGSMSATFERALQDLDNGTGLPYRDDEAGIPTLSQTFGWLATTRAEKAALRALFYLLAGRLGAVWLPTMASDLTLVATALNAANNIDVRHARYTVYGQQAVGRNHLRIERASGAVSYHKITGATEVSATVERLNVSPAISPQLTPAEVAQISFMQLHRQSSDALELGHFTGDTLEVRSAFTGFRHDL